MQKKVYYLWASWVNWIPYIKKDGRREPYNREKLRSGFLKSLEKRPVSLEKIEKTLDRIEAKLRKSKKKEIPSHLIGNLVIKELKKIDPVAYIRFASVYYEFKDVNEFKKKIKELDLDNWEVKFWIIKKLLINIR